MGKMSRVSSIGWLVAVGIVGLPLVFGVLSPARADELDQKAAFLVQQLAHQMREQRRTTVGVLDFTRVEDGTVNGFGRLLAEELVTRLTTEPGFQVVERRFLDKILQEQKWTQSDLVNPQTAVQFGQLTGVKALVGGTVADEGSYLQVNSRIVAAETGLVVATAAVRFAKDDRIARIMIEPIKLPEIPATDDPGPAVAKGFMDMFGKILSGAVSQSGAQPPAAAPAPLSAEDRKPPVVTTSVPMQSHPTSDWLFALRGCQEGNGGVTCQVSVTNKATMDKVLTCPPGDAYLFDQVGGEFKATHSEVMGRRFLEEMPVTVRMFFERATLGSVRSVALVLNCTDDRGNFRAQFRDVPIAR